MAKGTKGKISASSATRKKHAAKKADPSDPSTSTAAPKTKKVKGKNKAEPKPKVYIPPPKYQPLQPDPLDTYGLISSLPADLVVILRRLAKKDVITRKRALEELVEWTAKEDEAEDASEALILMLPVWFHHLPGLFTHPARQLRLSAVNVHHALLKVKAIRIAMLKYMHGDLTELELEKILGVWCMVSCDVDRQIAIPGKKCWEEAVTWLSGHDPEEPKLVFSRTSYLPPLANYLEMVLEDPLAVFFALHPPLAPPPPPPTSKSVGKQVTPFKHREQTESSPRAKGEMEEELEEDRIGRLRVGALGALTWILDTCPRSNPYSVAMVAPLDILLVSLRFWTHIHHAKVPSFVSPGLDDQVALPRLGYGYGQLGVRRCMWGIIKVLTSKWQNATEPYVELMSIAILRSAWVEPEAGVRSLMWEPLLSFLTKFPQAWEYDLRFSSPKADGEEEDDDSGDEDTDEDNRNRTFKLSRRSVAPDIQENGDDETTTEAVLDSMAYSEFLDFLRNGCNGSPVQGYPVVLVVLSTIPQKILPTSEAKYAELFSALWAAVDGSSLATGDRQSFRAFLSSTLECLVYLSGKAWRLESSTDTETGSLTEAPQSGREVALLTTRSEFRRVSSLLVGNSTLFEDLENIKILGRTFIRLCQLDDSLFEAAWSPFLTCVREIGLHGTQLSKSLATVFEQLQDTGCASAVQALVVEVGASALATLDMTIAKDESATSHTGLEMLLSVLQHFGGVLLTDPAFSQSLAALLYDNLSQLLATGSTSTVAELLIAYLSQQSSDGAADDMWYTLLASLGDRKVSEPHYVGLPVLQALCDALEAGRLPKSLKAHGHELDGLAKELLESIVDNRGIGLSANLLWAVLRQQAYLLDAETTSTLHSALAESIQLVVYGCLRDDGISTTPLANLLVTLEHMDSNMLTERTDFAERMLPSLFLAAYILPVSQVSGLDMGLPRQAQRIFAGFLDHLSASGKGLFLAALQSELSACVADVTMLARSVDIVKPYLDNAFSIPDLSKAVSVSDVLLPSALKDHLDGLSLIDFSVALSISDLLVPTILPRRQKGLNVVFDRYGFSAYARLASALLSAFSNDRSLARENVWALRHLVAFGVFTSDFLLEPNENNHVFAATADSAELQRLLNLTELTVSYTLSTITEFDAVWHRATLNLIRGDSDPNVNSVSSLLADMYNVAKEGMSAMATRILRSLLQHVMRHSARTDVELWLGLAQSVQSTAPGTCMALVLAVKEVLLEAPRFNRFQNELASRLLGVPPSRANSEGLPLLRLLIAAAPSSESSVSFIPQQRSVFLIQTLQKWLLSDEDLDEEIDMRLAQLLCYMAPVIQDVHGAHWDFSFDMLENNLEVCTSNNDPEFPLLYWSLKLLTTVRELCVTNSALREVWRPREGQALRFVRHLFLSGIDTERSNLRDLCRSLVTSLGRELPAALLDEPTVLSLYKLLDNTSLEVQKSAYQILTLAVPKITEQRVVEAAIATSDICGDDAESEIPTPKLVFALPAELIRLLLKPLDLQEDGEPTDSQLFGRQLGWMALFDYFTNASPALRSYYVDQLRDGDLLARSLFPTILSLLPFGKGGRPLAAQLWNLEEFYVDLYDEFASHTLSVMAAHLFYRALSNLSSLVRSWWLDIKDRQLSTSIASFAGTYFSPIIVNRELSRLKTPQAEDELAHENLSVRIATNVSEVTVAYIVDEQQMELGIRLPTDFPLHGVEVRDIKRVGVPVDKWRQWMLQIQQIITSQNGMILDALLLFKKNVTLYFEGVVECAICYSVISLTDRSLPRKPCKTCKNLFHNSCLYKWFNTSNQSSCPLCRSMF